jgi:hypothetical protein
MLVVNDTVPVNPPLGDTVIVEDPGVFSGTETGVGDA